MTAEPPTDADIATATAWLNGLDSLPTGTLAGVVGRLVERVKCAEQAVATTRHDVAREIEVALRNKGRGWRELANGPGDQMDRQRRLTAASVLADAEIMVRDGWVTP